jgi:cysteinyl-tRNA synthetase
MDGKLKKNNLKITNTTSGKKEEFSPAKKEEVSLYLCGMTVYDHCHLGHARSAIVFDIIRNYMEYKGWNVRFVKNFTDVDDKIIHRANQEGCDFKEIVNRYISAYEKDMARLAVRPPTLAPKATDHIPEMIALIEDLIEKGIAYAVSGNVYFEVGRFPTYGKLSARNLDEMLQGGGGRVETDENKKNPMDFALWKSAKAGEPSWESPWGPGRPGWHIECSAMAIKHLGKTIDLHGGGNDLIFPHHENEVAQSEAYTGQAFVRYFIHHGHVMVNNEKMSKSLGNFFTIEEIFNKSHFSEAIVAEVIRFYLLSTHYRSPIEFSDVALSFAKAGLDNFYEATASNDNSGLVGSLGENDLCWHFRARFEAAMDDDFNTVEAIAVLQQLRREANTKPENAMAIRALIISLGGVLGLFKVPVEEWRFRKWDEAPVNNSSSFQEAVDARNKARQEGNFALADQIRKALSAQGIILEDRPDGTTRVKR